MTMNVYTRIYLTFVILAIFFAVAALILLDDNLILVALVSVGVAVVFAFKGYKIQKKKGIEEVGS